MFKILKTLPDQHPQNMSETQILVLAISGSHLLTKANPLKSVCWEYRALKDNLGCLLDLSWGPGPAAAAAPGSLVEMHILGALQRPLQPESQGGGHSKWFQQALQGSLV